MLGTTICLPRGKGEIQYGDILKSPMTQDVIVMLHQKTKKPIVKVIDSDVDFHFDLQNFVNAWGNNLWVEKNINIYK